MSRSGEGAGGAPLAVAAGGGGPAARPGEAGFDGQVALGLVGLGVVGHVLRSRRFYENVAVAVIVVGALRGIGQDNRASTMARLKAWDRRQVERVERRAQRQGRAVRGSARMARSGPPRGLAGEGPQN
jgi:hypothetical protein